MTSSNLGKWLDAIGSTHNKAIDLGLDRLSQVAQRLDCVKPAKLVITVAGTNGKGSTCALLAQVLQQKGLRVGLYLSPHIQTYNERIRIQGRMLADTELCQGFAQIEQVRGKVSLTYFEFTTLLALHLFTQANLDVAILEVGLGGRLDATNLIDADIAIVSSIGLDHQDWLGDDLNTIAREKAGIFRSSAPAIFSAPDRPVTIDQVAKEVDAKPFWRDQHFSLKKNSTSWNWYGLDKVGNSRQYENLPYPNIPLDNAAGAIQALALTPWVISASLIVKSLITIDSRGCFQKLEVDSSSGEKVQLILDVAHNPHAASYLCEKIKSEPSVRRTSLVFACLKNKDGPTVMETLLPVVDEWFVSTIADQNAYSSGELENHLTILKAKVQSMQSIELALISAINQSRAGDRVVVAGSCHTVGVALNWLEEHKAKFFELNS